MRNIALVGALLVAVSLTACGAGEDSSGAEKTSSKVSAAEIAHLPQFKIGARRGSAPRGLVIHDVRKGTGTVMRRGDTILIDWAEVPYGKALVASPSARRLKFTFGKFIKGWEEGLPGMKVGGRRELIVPTRLGDTGGPMIYQVDLLAVEPPPKGSSLTQAAAETPSRPPRATLKMSKAEIAKLPPLAIPKPSGPPPRHFEAIDLRQGSGSPVTKADVVSFRYLEDTYPEALKGIQGGLSGGEIGPLSYPVSQAPFRSLRTGMLGMKFGGRRELVVPPKAAYPRWKPSWGYAPYVSVFVVDLLGVEPPPDPVG